jgi:hypothetical protein
VACLRGGSALKAELAAAPGTEISPVGRSASLGGPKFLLNSDLHRPPNRSPASLLLCSFGRTGGGSLRQIPIVTGATGPALRDRTADATGPALPGLEIGSVDNETARRAGTELWDPCRVPQPKSVGESDLGRPDWELARQLPAASQGAAPQGKSKASRAMKA